MRTSVRPRPLSTTAHCAPWGRTLIALIHVHHISSSKSMMCIVARTNMYVTCLWYRKIIQKKSKYLIPRRDFRDWHASAWLDSYDQSYTTEFYIIERCLSTHAAFPCEGPGGPIRWERTCDFTECPRASAIPYHQVIRQLMCHLCLQKTPTQSSTSESLVSNIIFHQIFLGMCQQSRQ